MKDEKLERILKKIDISECEPIIDGYIYYCRKPIKSRFSKSDGTYGYCIDECEFLVIVSENEKQGIIMRCDTSDLHWFVLRPWRNKHVLSTALQTGVIRDIWPENESITCQYSWRDKVKDRPDKYNKTKHLADIAGLKLR